MLATILTLPFHSAELITGVESIEREEESVRRRTLGQVLHSIRSRATIDPAFDELLGSFLFRRNLLVHEFHERKDFDLHTELGRKLAAQFTTTLCKDGIAIQKVLTAVFMAWLDQFKHHNEGLHFAWEEWKTRDLEEVYKLLLVAHQMMNVRAK